MGVFCAAPDELVAEPLGVAAGEELLAGAELLADADGEALAVSLAELEAPDAPGEEPEPALNVAPPAAVEVTDTSLSGAAPRLMITIRSGASEPLG
jgi:hypothetical protein